MKIILVSDSHGNKELLDKIYFANQDSSILLHCGDSELPDYIMNNFIQVKGNCDYFGNYPKFFEIDTPYGKLHMEHSNRLQGISEQYIKSLECKIFVFGHTHEKCFKKIGDIYLVNPGSLTRPRDESKGSYAILEISQSKVNVIFKYV